MLPAGGAPPEVFRGLIEKRAPEFGVGLAAVTIELLSRFLAELDVARHTTNLTGRLTPTDLVDHSLESIVGESLIPSGVELVDIGSGAGFPGIPLAIARPDLSVTALEPRRKRVEFLRHVVRVVPVKNATAREARAQDLDEESFDVATIRAIGGLSGVIRNADFLKSGSLLLLWTTESRLLRKLGPSLVLERLERVPQSREKVIALYARTPNVIGSEAGSGGR